MTKNINIRKVDIEQVSEQDWLSAYYAVMNYDHDAKAGKEQIINGWLIKYNKESYSLRYMEEYGVAERDLLGD